MKQGLNWEKNIGVKKKHKGERVKRKKVNEVQLKIRKEKVVERWSRKEERKRKGKERDGERSRAKKVWEEIKGKEWRKYGRE